MQRINKKNLTALLILLIAGNLRAAEDCSMRRRPVEPGAVTYAEIKTVEQLIADFATHEEPGSSIIYDPTAQELHFYKPYASKALAVCTLGSITGCLATAIIVETTGDRCLASVSNRAQCGVLVLCVAIAMMYGLYVCITKTASYYEAAYETMHGKQQCLQLDAEGLTYYEDGRHAWSDAARRPIRVLWRDLDISKLNDTGVDCHSLSSLPERIVFCHHSNGTLELNANAGPSIIKLIKDCIRSAHALGASGTA